MKQLTIHLNLKVYPAVNTYSGAGFISFRSNEICHTDTAPCYKKFCTFASYCHVFSNWNVCLIEYLDSPDSSL